MTKLIDEEEFLKDVAIDPDMLDELWMLQPQIFCKYSDNCFEILKDLENIKIELDIKKIDIITDIMNDPKKYGLKKTTDAILQSAIFKNKSYKDLYDKYISINNDYKRSIDRTKSLVQKKEALESLVKLHGQSYFAGPLAPKQLEKGERFLNSKALKNNIKHRRTYNERRK